MILTKNEKNTSSEHIFGYTYNLYLVAVRNIKKPKIVSFIGPIQGEYSLTNIVENATNFSCFMEAKNNKEALAKAANENLKDDLDIKDDFDMEHPFVVAVTIKTYEALDEESSS